MKKFIITGGAGFIGSTLVKALLEKGAESILIIDDLSTGSESNISSVLNDERIEFINSRIEDLDYGKFKRLSFDEHFSYPQSS